MPECWSKSSKQASIGRAAAVLMFASAVRDGRAMRAPSARPSTAIIGSPLSEFHILQKRPAHGLVIARASDEWLRATQLSLFRLPVDMVGLRGMSAPLT